MQFCIHVVSLESILTPCTIKSFLKYKNHFFRIFLFALSLAPASVAAQFVCCAIEHRIERYIKCLLWQRVSFLKYIHLTSANNKYDFFK